MTSHINLSVVKCCDTSDIELDALTMRICSIYYTKKPGGLGLRLSRLINALAENNHDVFFLTLDPELWNFDSRVRRIKIPFIASLRSGYLFWALFIPWSILFTAYFTFQRRVDRFVVFGAFYSAISSFASLISGIPIILLVRSLVFEINRINNHHLYILRVADFIEKVGLISAKKIIAMSECMKNKLLEFVDLNSSKILILSNDIPKTSIVKSNLKSEDKFIIATGGVLDARKNIPLLIDAVLKFPNPKPSFKLIIAGDGPLLETFKKQIPEDQISNFKFTGWVPSLFEVFKDADLVVHPSLHEGVPNSVLEALAINIPTIVADTDEAAEIFDDPEMRFSPHSVAELCTKIYDLINDPKKLRNLAEINQKVADKLRFNWDQKAIELILKNQ